jgi:hypothetical protein
METRGGPAQPDGGQAGQGAYDGRYGAAGEGGEASEPTVRAWGGEPGSAAGPTNTGVLYPPPAYPAAGYPVPPAPPAKTKRRVPLWGTVLTGFVCLGIGAAAGGTKDAATSATGAPVAAGVPSVSVSVSPSPVVTTVFVTATAAAPAPAPSKAAPPAPTTAAPVVIPGDGTYIVGTDIKPGRYKTTGPADSSFPDCYWERDRNLDGGLGSIIANDNTQGQTTVQIRSGDAAFKTTGCADWVKVG